MGAQQRPGDHGQAPTGAGRRPSGDVRGQPGKCAESMPLRQSEWHQGREDPGGERQAEARGQGVPGPVGACLGDAAAPCRQHHACQPTGSDAGWDASVATVTSKPPRRRHGCRRPCRGAGARHLRSGPPRAAPAGRPGHGRTPGTACRVFLFERHTFGSEETTGGLDVEGAEDAPDRRRGRAVEVPFAHGVMGHVTAAAAGDQDFGAQTGGAVQGHDAGPGAARAAVMAAIRPAAPAPMTAIASFFILNNLLTAT